MFNEYSSVEGCGFYDISEECENLSVYITLARAMNIIHGYDDNTFRPSMFVTYNEAIKMLVNAFDLIDPVDTFNYPDDYIRIAEKNGITSGIVFIGEDYVNKQDFMVMLTVASANYTCEIISGAG